MKLLRVLSYPAIPMMLIAAIVVAVHVPYGHRLQTLTMLSSASFGATEIVFGVLAVMSSPLRGGAPAAHMLSGSGALLISFAMLSEVWIAPFIAGCLLFSAGILAWQRPRPLV